MLTRIRPLTRAAAPLARFSVGRSVRFASSASQASAQNPDPAPSSSTGKLVQTAESFMVPTYSRPLPVFDRAKGMHLFDIDGRRYLDFTAGIAVTSLGHCDDQVAAVIADQSRTLIHASNLFHNSWTGRLSEALVTATRDPAQAGMHNASRAFICNSGSEANEAAIKFARKVAKSRAGDVNTPKIEVVSFQNGFHGRTMGALSATPNPKYQVPFGPMLPGFRVGTYNDVAGIDQLVTDNTCAVIVEPIQGEGGVHAATPEFLTALRARCTAVGAVLIYDEIQCGMSRTGRLWAHSHLPPQAHPDIITTAKALGNGFPVGATIVNESVASHIVIGDHGTTFGGNPLASRVALHCLERLASPELQAEVTRKGKLLETALAGLRKDFPDTVQEVRGKGLIRGLQLSIDPTPIIRTARENGLLIITAGQNTLRFLPAYIVTDEQIQEAVDILRKSIRSVIG